MNDQNVDDFMVLMSEARRLRFEDPAEAQRLFEKAVEESRKQGSPQKLIQALKGVGQIARDLRANDLALRLYQEAVALCRNENDALLLAHTVRHVGDIHQDMKRDDLAAPCYEEALGIYRSHRETSKLDLANAVRPFALLKENAGAIDEAKQMWAEARDLYAAASVPEGVKECSRRLALLENA
jgi:tetratricopeptide (TPR) repeat protein